jgi:hypothetical protein
MHKILKNKHINSKKKFVNEGIEKSKSIQKINKNEKTTQIEFGYTLVYKKNKNAF